VESWLSPYDGSISKAIKPDGIHGYLYIFEEETNSTCQEIGFDKVGSISALPCQCPCCNRNYVKRIYTKSPIEI
jgi:hypothetical protein